MKQICVISGKGGTGKTFITANLAALLDKTITVDCDVDASNLHLLLKPVNLEKKLFFAGSEFFIDKDICLDCGACAGLCRFKAIYEKDGRYFIDGSLCESCGLCMEFCQERAIVERRKACGWEYQSFSEWGPFISASLFPGSDNSGKLVTAIRKRAEITAGRENEKYERILIDGPPGIGCPVMASITNTDFILIAAEPTPSAVSDLERVLKLAKQFRAQIGAVINKFDLNKNLTARIRKICAQYGADIIGLVPFSEKVVDSISNAEIYVLKNDDNISLELKKIKNGVLRRTS